MLSVLLTSVAAVCAAILATSRQVAFPGTGSATVLQGAWLSHRVAAYQYAGRPMPMTRAVPSHLRLLDPHPSSALAACQPA